MTDKTHLFNIIFEKVFLSLKRIESIFKSPIRVFKYGKLKRQNFSVYFSHEGNTAILLPKVSIWNLFFGHGSAVNRNHDFFSRPFSEGLLRKTIFDLYQNGYINRKLSIIDIGSWIGDNSLVWSTFLTDKASVYAIDPSAENLSYGKQVAEINGLKNIKWIEAVCADKSGIRLEFEGSINHTRFREARSDQYLISTTIDEVIESENVGVGLFHVDVEGFELAVLKGAELLIKRDRPVISFEQHISEEDFNSVSEYIKAFGYRIFMINEVLPSCALDCRNFLALPVESGLPKLTHFEQDHGRSLGIYSAVIGPALIEV